MKKCGCIGGVGERAVGIRNESNLVCGGCNRLEGTGMGMGLHFSGARPTLGTSVAQATSCDCCQKQFWNWVKADEGMEGTFMSPSGTPGQPLMV